MSFNLAIIKGIVTTVPIVQGPLANGKMVLKFRVLTSNGNAPDGTRRRGDLHQIVYWSSDETLIDRYKTLVKKGGRATIHGRISYNKWTGTDGQERQKTEIVASSIDCLVRESDDNNWSDDGATEKSEQQNSGVGDRELNSVESTPG